jgi:uncharacterized protein with HEPN domain
VKSSDEFISNPEKVDAVILILEQIGETAIKLSSLAKNRYPDVNWPGIIGLRNMISHKYEGIRLQIIYEIAVNRIPKLILQLKSDAIQSNQP